MGSLIRLTKQTDYGIVLLTRMGERSVGSRFNARDLAAKTQIRRPMVSKVLKALSRKGLLDSYRGAKGGYSLTRAMGEISVGEVISALEGPIAFTDCAEAAPCRCEIEPMCPCRSHWQRISQVVAEALNDLTLAEMARPVDFEKKPIGLNPPSGTRPEITGAEMETEISALG